MAAMEKAFWRRELRAVRKAVQNREESGRLIWQRLTALPEWTTAKRVLLYVDVRGEVPTRDVLAEQLKQGKRRVGLPWCDGDILKAVEICSLNELVPGRFGIPEPVPELRANPERMLQAADFDLILVPAVGFDRHGQRLGSGQGFYDRYLENAGQDCCLCGIGFDCQVVQLLPTEPHDRRMDLIVTESEVLRFQ